MMMLRVGSASIERSRYDDQPFARVLFRYLWPFWLFRDVTRGDSYARAAAYRHNRSMRVYLPGYLVKWMFNCGLALGATAGLEAASGHPRTLDAFQVMAAGSGVVFACCVVVLFATGYVYLYLGRNEA
jgi:hypothetical protein